MNPFQPQTATRDQLMSRALGAFGEAMLVSPNRGRGHNTAAGALRAKLWVTYLPPFPFSTPADARRSLRRAARWLRANPGETLKEAPNHIRWRADQAVTFLNANPEA